MLLWEGCQSSAQRACYLPSLSHYPFIHLHREEQVRVKYLALSRTQHTILHGVWTHDLGSWVQSSTTELHIPRHLSGVNQLGIEHLAQEHDTSVWHKAGLFVWENQNKRRIGSACLADNLVLLAIIMITTDKIKISPWFVCFSWCWHGFGMYFITANIIHIV